MKYILTSQNTKHKLNIKLKAKIYQHNGQHNSNNNNSKFVILTLKAQKRNNPINWIHTLIFKLNNFIVIEFIKQGFNSNLRSYQYKN